MKTVTIRLSDDMHYKLKELTLQQSRDKKDGKVTMQSLMLNQLHLLVPDAKLEDDEQEE